MPDLDKTGVPGHEVPPPKPLPPKGAAIGALVFDIAALVVIYFGRCDLAALLIILAALLGGYVVCRLMMMSSPSDKRPVDGHEPPPP
ncbi:MAG: hypothetical protein ABUT39_13250 [Acidobacteriota bacterium]